MQTTCQAPATTSAASAAQPPWLPESLKYPVSLQHVLAADAVFASTGLQAPLPSSSLSQAGSSFTLTTSSSPSQISAQIKCSVDVLLNNNNSEAAATEQHAPACNHLAWPCYPISSASPFTTPQLQLHTSLPLYPASLHTSAQNEFIESTFAAPNQSTAARHEFDVSPFAAPNPGTKLLSSFACSQTPNSFQSPQNPFFQAQQMMAPQSLCSQPVTTSFPSSFSTAPSSAASNLYTGTSSAASHMTHVAHMDYSTASSASASYTGVSTSYAVPDFDMLEETAGFDTSCGSSRTVPLTVPVLPLVRTRSGADADLQHIKRLGSGAYGQVYLAKLTLRKPSHSARWHGNGTCFGCVSMPAAIKYANPQGSILSESVECLQREAAALKLVAAAGGHPNVLSLIGDLQNIVPALQMYAQTTIPGIALEYAHLGSLEQLLHSKDESASWERMQKLCGAVLKLPNLPQCMHSLGSRHQDCRTCAAVCCALLQVLSDAAEGLDCVHTLATPMTHNDVKPGNILISAKGSGKLGDFGLATCHTVDDTVSPLFPLDCGQFGTATYAAPEVMLGTGKLSAASDMYSWGCMLWEIFSGMMPWGHLREPDPRQFWDFGAIWIYQRMSAGQGLAMDESWPAGVLQLLNRCLSFDPADRPSASEAVAALQQEIQRLTYDLVTNL